MSKIAELAGVPDVSFMDNLQLAELEQVVKQEYSEAFREIYKKAPTLADGDTPTLILKAVTQICYQVMQRVDMAGKMQLLPTSSGPYLDNLAALFGITRNGAQSATTTIRFTLSAAQKSAVSIPAGTRVRTGGGIYFATEEYAEIPIGETTVDVVARAQETGLGSNGILPGAIDTLVDPIPYVASATNTDESSGGTDVEDDDSLTRRVFLAPSVYSSAGPVDAYEYYARAWRSDVTDVKVVSPSECVVNIYFMLEDGRTPSETDRREMAEYMSAETMRPMCDKVVCLAPEDVEYSIDVTYWIARSDTKSANTIQENVQRAVEEFKDWQRTLGRDVNPTELNYRIRAAGAKRVKITAPGDITISNIEIAKAVSTNIVYGGIEDD